MSSEAAAPSPRDQREFARIAVAMPAHVRPLDEDGADAVAADLALSPSVWGPSNEISIGDLVTAGSSNHEAMLAQAVLELSAEIVRLRAEMFDDADGMIPVEVVEISGGGGRFKTGLELEIGDLIEIRFAPDDEIPPIRAVARIRHRHDDPDRNYGFGYERIHRLDQDRMIRLIYLLQRRALRDAHREESGD